MKRLLPLLFLLTLAGCDEETVATTATPAAPETPAAGQPQAATLVEPGRSCADFQFYKGGQSLGASATIDPIVHFNPKGRVDFYVFGGAGLFHRYQEFTAPTVSVLTGFDPFFGFTPIAVPANQVLSSYSVNKPGMDIGAGIAFGSKWHGKFFAEAKYMRIFESSNRRSDTEYLPVTFGFRW